MSLSPWNWYLERIPLLDFVPAMKDNEVLAVIPKPPEFDLGLFIRPFTKDSWIGIGAMLVIGSAALSLPMFAIKYYRHLYSKKIVIISCWCLFVLINAFYGGALTMFFISETTVPFESLRDALRAFPDWNLVYQEGNEAFFHIPASQVETLSLI